MMVWELHSAVQDEALAVTGNTAEIAMGGGGEGVCHCGTEQSGHCRPPQPQL